MFRICLIVILFSFNFAYSSNERKVVANQYANLSHEELVELIHEKIKSLDQVFPHQPELSEILNPVFLTKQPQSVLLALLEKHDTLPNSFLKDPRRMVFSFVFFHEAFTQITAVDRIKGSTDEAEDKESKIALITYILDFMHKGNLFSLNSREAQMHMSHYEMVRGKYVSSLDNGNSYVFSICAALAGITIAWKGLAMFEARHKRQANSDQGVNDNKYVVKPPNDFSTRSRPRFPGSPSSIDAYTMADIKPLPIQVSDPNQSAWENLQVVAENQAAEGVIAEINRLVTEADKDPNQYLDNHAVQQALAPLAMLNRKKISKENKIKLNAVKKRLEKYKNVSKKEIDNFLPKKIKRR